MSQKINPLRFHAPTGQYYVWHNKARVHMGADLPTAESRYAQWKLDLLAAAKQAAPELEAAPALAGGGPVERTVNEVLLAYYRHARVEYAENRTTLHRLWQAIEAVREPGLRMGELPVSRFRGPQLKSVREHLVSRRRNKKAPTEDLSRTYVNYLIACVQRCWTWALSEDLVPADAAATIGAVKPLGAGKGGKEPERVMPPAAGWDEALIELPSTLVAMVRVQALCGMRPQDVCRMKRCELSTSPAEKVAVPGSGQSMAALDIDGARVWLYAPGKHKMTWRGKPRVVAIGPKAQALLAPLIAGLAPNEFVFRPSVALKEAKRGNRHKNKGYKPGYSPGPYARLIARAIERVNNPRIRARWKDEELVPHWAPNQLRHLAATVVGDEIDREHARALLGHTSDTVIDRYMEQQVGKAARAAAECG